MISFEQFEQGLLDALAHFHDLAYQPPAVVCTALGCEPRESMPAVQAAVTRAIEALQPPAETPTGAYSRIVHEVLHERFVLGITQEEVAYRLHVSRRTINRLQRRAVRVLAGALWAQSQGTRRAGSGSAPSEQADVSAAIQAETEIEEAPRRLQMQRELESLQAKTPDAQSDVGQVIADVLDFLNPLAEKLGVRLEARFVQPGLVAAVHPVVLSQVLIALARRWARHTLDGQVLIYATLEGGNAKITLTGAAAGEDLAALDITGDIPVPESVSVETCLDGRQAFVWLRVPSAGKVTVLVVDDNEDIVRLYRDAALGTRYHIVHTPQGRDLFDVVKATAPEIIVLDIMLPDVDGWRLLLRLHEDPSTRGLPIIVCSVVGDAELAYSLGAVCYLAKPVRPLAFIQALDQVLAPAQAAASVSSTSSAGAG